MPSLYDVVVVGAGPYGLSAAAHLRARGGSVAVFGRTLEMWRAHMPQGMRLRSHWWATTLADPSGDFAFTRFLRESNLDPSYPLPIETFVRYGLWFQQRAVPEVDETYVSGVARRDDRFRIELEDGREVESRAVVMAVGMRHYAHRPELYRTLPTPLVSHSSDHRDFSRFSGRKVIVIGGGQSAIEFAALLREAGAAVDVVSRRPINWLLPDRGDNPSVLERVVAPDASVAPGWVNWVWDHAPYLFYRFPQAWKDRYNATYPPGANDWLRDRITGKVTLFEGRAVTGVRPLERQLDVTLSDGATLRADHILLATGYRADLNRLTMLRPSLRGAIRSDRGIPVLSPHFESSVPGLYFVGFTSVRAFGPLYRFVAGCGAAARRVAGALAPVRSRRYHGTPQPGPGNTQDGHAPVLPEPGRLETDGAD